MDRLDAYRAAKILVDQHGTGPAWDLLIERAIQENEAGQTEGLAITRAVLAALTDMTRPRRDGERVQ